MRLRAWFFLGALLPFFASSSAAAATFRGPAIYDAETAVVVTESEIVSDDLYVFGTAVVISGDVAGDVYVVGGEVTVEGTVRGDVVALAGTVHVPGIVTESVRAVGGDVEVTGLIGNDVLFGGGTFVLGEAGKVNGDVVAVGGSTTILGSVAGNLLTRGEGASISGTVDGYADLHASKIAIASSAVIGENLTTESVEPLTVDREAMVGGEVTNTVRPVHRTTFLSRVFAGAWKSVTLLLVALLLFGIFGKKSSAVVHEFQGPVGKNALWGVLAMLLSLPIFILLLVTVVGIPFAIFFAFLVPVLLYISAAYGALFLGNVLRRRFVPSAPLQWVDALIGVLLLWAVALVPGLGTVAEVAFIIYSLGVVLRMEVRLIEAIRHIDLHPHA
jgi:cytoskeletal protein CcmA (bactofilin family)